VVVPAVLLHEVLVFPALAARSGNIKNNGGKDELTGGERAVPLPGS
jgi:hypothetical protein